MNLTADAIFEAAKQLSDAERERLIDLLLDEQDSHDETFFNPEYLFELERRFADKEGFISEEEFLKELNRRAAEPENSVPAEDLWKAVDGEMT
jgi:hypothetical protein